MSDPSTAKSPPKGTKKLGPKDWLEIINLAENGSKVQKIADIYGVHASLIYRGLQARHVNLGAAAERASKEAADKDRQVLIDKIRDTKNKDYRFTEFLQGEVVKTIVGAQKAGKAIGSVIDDVKTLKAAIDAITSGTNNKWRILGLDKDNTDLDKALPEIVIREMTQEEVQAIRDRQDREDGMEFENDLDDELLGDEAADSEDDA